LKKLSNRLKDPERRFKEMTINNKTNIIYLTEFNEFCYIIVILSRNKNLELAKLNIDIGKKIYEKEIININ
jgi:predicted regulator of Ras-like GTPase activity (Roadblock/LC7/MglB family)